MNRTFTVSLIAVALVAAIAGYSVGDYRSSHLTTATAKQATTPDANSERKVLYWYDPMVPDKRFSQPGKSPFMDMR